MTSKKITLIGATGFVGNHLLMALTSAGYHCKILVRRPHRHRNLLLLPNLRIVELENTSQNNLNQLLTGSDTVINLVGILNEDKTKTFEEAHVKLPERILEACLQNKIPRLLHMSALNANESQNVSHYLKTKGQGENHVHTLNAGVVHVTSYQPSVIFGEGDSFISKFAQLLSIPGPLPLACANARFAPVYVGDLVQLMLKTLNDKAYWGKHLQVCGPEEYSLEQLIKRIAWHKGIYKSIIPLSPGLSRLQAKVLQNLPGKLFTLDNYRSLQCPSVCDDNALDKLDIKTTFLESMLAKLVA